MHRLLDLTARAEADHFWFHGFRSFVTPVIASLADGRRDLRLIDCGCGTGHNLRLLARHGRAVGFDLAAGQFPHTVEPNGLKRRLVRADLLRIPFPTDSFDIATSFDVMQCVASDEEALREIARVVRPGGAVVLTLAALDILSGDHGEVWGEVRRYSPSGARSLVEQAGLRVERITFLFASVFPLMLAVRLSQRLLRPFRALRDDTDIRVPPAPINGLLSAMVRAEAGIARFVPMPVGSSILVVGRKRA